MSKINITVEQLNSMKAFDIAKSEIVRDKFITIYDTLWGAGTGEPAYERESIYFNKILREKPELQKCTPFSLFTAFIDIAVCGLTLEQGTRALCYLIKRNTNIGTRERAVWEVRARLEISAYGELVLRERAGQIRHADNPVLVYSGDEFSFSDRNGQKVVDYTCHLPHNGQRIIACYLRITRADGSIDYSVMTEEDWVRLAQYSARQSSKNIANELYGVDANGVVNIDPGFLMAKCVKHAFKTYPKVRIGRGSVLQSQQVEEKEIEINNDLYGVDGVDPETGEVIEPAVMPRAASFGPPANDISAGVTVETDDDDAF
ncbi:MAG: recombinase RecT [Muribaculaceae bacterium]|nr:recombinase RecT [Muribaculaceae bacterium]